MTTTGIPAAEQAYRHAKEMVLDGRLAPASMTSEGEIAEQLGLSRTPVREAFLRLEAEGLMSLYPKRGAMITPIGAHEVEEVFEARQLVESHAAHRLIELTDTQLDTALSRLDRILADQVTAVATADVSAYVALDTQFHQEIVACGANRLLTDFAASLRERQQRLIAQSVRWDLARAQAFIADHRGLLEALRQRDFDTYESLLAVHLETARANL